MSHLESTQDGTGVTLETEVEAGASGYSVAGGGDQGIFVKQVLKDSSAAKLFSLREGDQLLSTTIFFDNIKYEDALKILQYSEPYKVQFKIRRKLPAGAAEDDVAGSAEPGPRVGEDQDQDVADRCTETPTKTPQGDGDQQRLLPTPREGRGRRAQRERLSWPKFQALKGKRGPRRSHSSSEAYERGQGPDLSPTSTDTEARLPAEEQAREDELGSQRRRRFPSLRFRVVSGKGTSSRGDRGGAGPAELLEEAGPSEAEQEAITAAGRAETGDMKAGQPEEAEAPTEPALPGEGPAPRLRRKKAQARGLEETLAEEHAEVGTVRGQTREGTTEDTQGPQLGTARLTRHGSIDQGTYQNGQPEVRIRIPSLKTPKFRVARETVPEDAEGTAPVRWGPWWTQVSADDSRATGDDEGDTESQTMKRPQATQRTKGQGGGEEDAVEKSAEASKEGDQETEETEGKTRVLKFKLPSFGWSPAKEGKGHRTTQIQETDKQDSGIAGATDTEGKGKDRHGRDSKFKTPKFKMPSFGVSAPSKAIETAVDVSLPKAQAEVTLPSVQADVKTSEVRVELPAAELDVKGAEVAVKLPEGPLPEAELKEGAAGVGIKAHLPKVQMPSVKLPKVDIKAPQVDIKGPKLDLKGAKAEVAAPDVEVSLPSVEVDSQAPGAKLEADVSLGDKEGATRICTLKTEDDGKIHVKKPHFKFPRLFSSSGKSSKSSTLIESDPHLSLAPSVSDVDPALSHISSHKPSLPFPHMGWPGVSSGSLDVSRSHAESSSVSPEAVTLIKYQVTVPDAPHFPPEILSCSQEDRKSPTTLRPEESVPCPPDTPASPVDPLLPASYGRVTFPKFHRPKFWFSSPEAADPAVDGQAAERAPAPWPLSDAQGLDSARGLPLADGSQGHGSGDVSAGQPHGEGTAPSPGERLQPLCRAAGVDAPVEGSTAALGGWFRMPALHLPIIRHPAREKGVPGAPSPMPAACAVGEEEPAPISAQGPLGSEVEAPETLEPAEKIASHAGMLKINLDGRGSTPLPPPPEAPPVGLSTSEIRVRPGEGSLPLRMPSGALLETETPPAGPAGLDLARGEGRAEKWSSQPEGPVKLKVSRTDGPSQISVVSVGQPWEGSVVTVKLPRLSMPRFAFPDPGSEADVFIPAVQEVQCAGSSLDDAWCAESVGAWGASILKAGAGTPGEQPVAFDLSPEASRVRVHIHSAQGEGAGVGIHAGVTPEPAGRPGPEAVSTQIVRESEIPASEIQTASYGFSLLKVKIPEPPTQGRVQDSRLTGGLQEASEDAAPGADPVSGDLQPDTGEPFEVISSSISVPRGPALTADLHSGPPGTESCSDEEPAEILEFPPEEDGEEAAAGLSKGDQAPKEKPEGKRSSGLLRFWLPSIGFSSSSEEARADSKDEAHGPAPVQTPPGLQPEAEPPKKSEKASWFRFPKLGFSSSPTKKGKSLEDEAAPAEQKLQEEAATFFDARENFSPEDREETVPGAGAMVTSRARTELILLEPDPGTLDEPAPGPAAQ